MWNAGQTHACGAGIFHKHGENIATTSINYVFGGAGAHNFCESHVESFLSRGDAYHSLTPTSTTTIRQWEAAT